MMLKKIVMLFVAAVALFTIADFSSTTVSADSEWYTVPGVEGGKVLFDPGMYTIFELESTVTVAHIPETIDGVPVKRFSNWAFRDCSLLSVASLPAGITELPLWLFRDCESLVSVDIPDSVTKIDNGVFWGCSSLRDVNIPSAVTTIGYSAFSGCSSLVSVNIPHGVTEIKSDTFYDCSSLYSVTIPETVTTIKDDAFSRCSSLKEIEIPKSVTEIERSAFYKCESLVSIDIPYGVTVIEHDTFYGCTDLVSVSIPSTVQTIDYQAFWYCSSLLSVVIPEGITELQRVFVGCSSLQSVVLPQSLKIIDSAFSGCTSLTSIKLPDGLVQLSGFAGCESLREITIPDSVISLGDSTFLDCTSLTSVTIPGNVGVIPDYLFDGCSSLESVVLQEGITSIYYHAFWDCPELKYMSIPKSLAGINSDAFREYSSENNLEKIYYAGTKSEIGSIYSDFNKKYLDVVYSSAGGAEAGGTTLGVGESLDLSDIDFSGTVQSRDITINSSNPEIVSVQGKVITAKAVGTVMLSIKAEGSSSVYTYGVTVVPAGVGETPVNLNFGNATGSDTLTGPTLSVNGEDFSLFDLPITIDSGAFDHILGMEMINDPEEMTTRILIKTKGLSLNEKGTESAYSQVKNTLMKQHSLSNIENAFKAAVANEGSGKWNAGFNFNVAGMGYIELDNKTGEALFKEGGLLLKLTFSASARYPLPPAPVIYVKVGIVSNSTGGLTFYVEDTTHPDADVMVKGTLSSDLTTSLSLNFDAVLASAGGGIDGTLGFNLLFPNNTMQESLSIDLSANLFLEWDALYFVSGRLQHRWLDYSLYPNLGPKGDISSSLEENPFNIEFQPMVRTSEYANNTPNYNIEPNTNFSENIETIQDNIFQNAEPDMITVGDTTVMVYEMDSATRPSGDRTMLVYSTKTPTGWSTPKAVEDDFTADFSPTLFEINNEIYLLWVNTVSSIGGSPTLELAMSNTVLRVARFDGSGFINAINVVEPNGLYPMLIDVSTNSDEATIAWMENDVNSALDFLGEYSIKSTTFDGTIFTDTKLISSGTNPIMALSGEYAFDGGYRLGFAENRYTNSTLQRSAVKLYEDGSISEISSSDSLKSNLSLIDNYIFYIENGVAVLAESNGVSQEFPLSDGVAIDKAKVVRDINGRLAIVYSVADGYHNELYIRFKNTTELTEPVTLTEDERDITSFVARYDEQNMLDVLFTSRVIDLNAAEDSSIYKQTDLREMTLTDGIDLEIVGEPYYNDIEMIPNDTATLFVDVRNNSSVPITSLNAAIDSDIAVKKTITLEPGEVGTIEVYDALSRLFSDQSGTITISPSEGVDIDNSDNEVAYGIFFRDIEVVDYTLDLSERTATIMVKNNSNVEVNNISVKLMSEKPDGDVVSTKTIDTLSAGATGNVVFELPNTGFILDSVYDVEYYYATAEIAEPETFYHNNQITVALTPKRVVTITETTTHMKIQGGIPISIGAKALPEDALNTGLFYVSADDSIATVDDNGNVTGLRKGTTTVTVIAADNAISRSIQVDVLSSVTGISGEIIFYDATTDTLVELYASTDTARSTPLYTDTITAGVFSTVAKTERFEIQNIEVGTYDVVISKSNYLPYEVRGVEIQPDGYIDLGTVIGDIRLVTGDVDDNNVVNETDIRKIIDDDSYNKSTVDGAADVNGDNLINFIDIAIIRNGTNFNKSASDCIIEYG